MTITFCKHTLFIFTRMSVFRKYFCTQDFNNDEWRLKNYLDIQIWRKLGWWCQGRDRKVLLRQWRRVYRKLRGSLARMWWDWAETVYRGRTSEETDMARDSWWRLTGRREMKIIKKENLSTLPSPSQPSKMMANTKYLL